MKLLTLTAVAAATLTACTPHESPSFVWTAAGVVVVTVGMWWLTRRRTACTCPIPEAITDLRCPVHATPEHRHPDDDLDLPVSDADIAAAVDRLIGDIE